MDTAMNVKKQKYRRLQVENIKLRTLFEIITLIIAIVISCVVVINSYEKSYKEAIISSFEDSARQLVHSVSSVADRDAVGVENADRRAYVMQRYSDILDTCFIEEDVQYSGAIYSVGETNASLFSASADYAANIDNGAESPYAEDIVKCLKSAASGDSVTVMLDDTCLALEPVKDSETGEIYAVAAVAVDHRSSTEFNSPVKNRLGLISVVSGVLIVIYFAVSGARSQRKKLNGEVV